MDSAAFHERDAPESLVLHSAFRRKMRTRLLILHNPVANHECSDKARSSREAGMLETLRFIARHPLNRRSKLAAVGRYLCWQFGSRLVPGPVAAPFVNGTRLLVSPGMEATGHIYTGLREFEDMAFALHSLRPDDTFVDIGANVGSYTVLASGAVGARSISLEPVPQTYVRLRDNTRLNDIGSLVTTMNIGVGEAEGVVKFTAASDAMNHVAIDQDLRDAVIEVPIRSLDEIAVDLSPTLIKIDVEGYETSVIRGAMRTLAKDSLIAVLMELDGQGARYGFDESALHQRMLQLGFKPFTYSPFDRRLLSSEGRRSTSGNMLYIRDIDQARQRVSTAPVFSVHGREI